MKQVWQCDKCGRTWPEQHLAQKCEQRHCEVTGATAMNYGQRMGEGEFPERVKVTIKLPTGREKMEYDWAIYRIEHIGPKGL